MIKPARLTLTLILGLTLSLFLWLAGSVSAPAAAAPPVALKAGEILTGHFVQDRSLAGFSAPVRSEGRFILVPGKGLLWIGETPFPVTTVITPDGILQRVSGQEILRLSAAKAPFLARLHAMMSGALAGDWSTLEAGFTLQRTPRDGGETITLIPPADPAAAQPFRALTITVGRLVETVEVIRGDADRDLLRFSDQQITTSPLSPGDAALFTAVSAP